MKASIGFKFLVCALALTCILSTGCRKKPVGVTPLPGARAGQVPTPGPGNPFDTGTQVGGMTGGTATPVGIPSGPGHPGWAEDRETLKADSVYFDYDSSAIKGGEKSKIENVASYLKANTAVAVKVEGNCDERGTEEYNRALGERRALALREALSKVGVSPDRIRTLSYGKDKPADAGHDETAWGKNRRGEFILLHPKAGA
jgi:peptidoglycan-associated lipoprotein